MSYIRSFDHKKESSYYIRVIHIIAVRGHRELAESRNQGNFLEIVKLAADHDTVTKFKKNTG